MMGYRDRERYLKTEHYPFIFDRSGNATSSILVNGMVTGVWDCVETSIRFFLFEDLESRILKKIHNEAGRIGRFMLGKTVELNECDSMIPLVKRTAGGVFSPLKYY